MAFVICLVVLLWMLTFGGGIWALILSKRRESKFFFALGICGLLLGPAVFIVATLTAPPVAIFGSFPMGQPAQPWAGPRDEHNAEFTLCGIVFALLWLLIFGFVLFQKQELKASQK